MFVGQQVMPPTGNIFLSIAASRGVGGDVQHDKYCPNPRSGTQHAYFLINYPSIRVCESE